MLDSMCTVKEYLDYLAEKSRQSLPKKNQIQSQSKSCTYESFCSSNSLSGKDL